MRTPQGFGSLWHLAGRFAGSIVPVGPPKADQRWAIDQLSAGEAGLFASMSGADRRHAIGVARRAMVLLETGDGVSEVPTRAFVAAALLHDVGKTQARLGTLARVAATVAAVSLGRDKVVAWVGDAPLVGTRPPRPSRLSLRDWRTRMGRYLMHDLLGARLLEDVGSDELTSTWAREHHLPESRWTVEQRLGRALKEADGD